MSPKMINLHSNHNKSSVSLFNSNRSKTYAEREVMRASKASRDKSADSHLRKNLVSEKKIV